MTKAERSRNMRYKRPALSELGFDTIFNKLCEIRDACETVQWAVEGDEDILLNALDGNEEDEYEFKMAFSLLAAECENLYNELDEICRYDYDDMQRTFDDCTVALIGNRFRAVGYDDYEEDYFNLTSYECDLAHTESGKRVMRMTKEKMLSTIGQCLGIVLSFQNVQLKYDYLSATMDILREENNSILKTIKAIEEAYIEADEDEFREWKDSTRELDRLINSLPDKFWVE